MTKRHIVLLVLACFIPPVHADSWWDDFDDGNPYDGSPVTWTEFPDSPFCTYDASNGDYVFGTSFEAVVCNASVEEKLFSQVSIKTQGTVDGHLEIGVMFGDFENRTGYFGTLDVFGRLSLVRLDDNIDTLLDTTVIGIDATEEVWVQMDVVDGVLSLRAWLDGDPMVDPQIANVQDSTYTTGTAGIRFSTFPALLPNTGLPSGIFRFAHAVPEPSSCVFLVLASLSVLFKHRRAGAQAIPPVPNRNLGQLGPAPPDRRG